MLDIRGVDRVRLAQLLRRRDGLFVHAQTVRYRMGQLRELFGDLLDNHESVLRLTLALAVADGTRLD